LIEEAIVTASSSSRGRARILAGCALGAGAALLALSSCGAGQLAQTAQQQSAIAGVNGQAGAVALRNALIPFNGPDGYPQGGTAPIAVSIFNNGLNAVKLVDVTASAAANDVVLVGGPAVGAPIPSPTSAAPVPSGSASPGAASPSAAPAPAPAAPSGQTSFSVPIPSASYALLLPRYGTYLQLVGLKQALVPGTAVVVTFTFDNGMSSTMTLPVGPATAAVPRQPAVVNTSAGE
jgi:hypothetical protein